MNGRPLALVTGGGSGIGRATALSLAEAGWHVVINGRRQDALDETALLMDGHIDVLQGDLSVAGTATGLVTSIEQTHGRLDAFIHCAGHAFFTPLAEADVPLLRQYMAVHVEAALECVTRAWHLLQVADPGTIVLMSSMSAHDPFPAVGVYGMAKAALEALAIAIATDGGKAMNAFSIAAGCVDTPMLRGLFSEADLEGADMQTPEAIAAIVLEMVSGRHKAVSGSVVMTQGA